MNTQLLHLEDSETLEFEATLVETLPLADGKVDARLERTYFYPTGGGQAHDTGWIGPARVLDVHKEGGYTLHVLDRALALGLYPVRIDAERRLRHCQHHTAQHLLSACLLVEFGIDSVSAHINGNVPSTVDLAVANATPEVLMGAEAAVNQIVFAARPVRSYFVGPAELAKLPLRRPPAVSEAIRVVEIDGYDYTPCGGTHVRNTGSLGLVKIMRTERVNDKLRLHFVAGLQALEHFRETHDLLSGLAGKLGVAGCDLPAAVERLDHGLRQAERELETARAALLEIEAARLVEMAEVIGDQRLVFAQFERRPPQELRRLAEVIISQPGGIAVLASSDPPKLAVTVGCAPGSGLNARDLLARLLALLGGRGGGDARLAQGGGTATPPQVEMFLQAAGEIARNLT